MNEVTWEGGDSETGDGSFDFACPEFIEGQRGFGIPYFIVPLYQSRIISSAGL